MDVLGDLVDVLGKAVYSRLFWNITYDNAWLQSYLVDVLGKRPRNKPDCRAIWWMFWGNGLVTSLVAELFGGCFGETIT